MSQPVWNARPIIGQVGDTLKLLDRGDWATQEGAYPTRTCVHWQRRRNAGSGWEDVGGSVAPQRSKPDDVLLGEKAQTLKIGVDNFGLEFRVQVWAGVLSNVWDNDAWTPWIEWGSDRSTRPTPPEYAFSNTLTVAPWGQTPPPPPSGPPPFTSSQAKSMMVRAAKEWERANAAPLSRITLARRILELPDSGRPGWLDVREAVKALLDDGGE